MYYGQPFILCEIPLNGNQTNRWWPSYNPFHRKQPVHPFIWLLSAVGGGGFTAWITLLYCNSYLVCTKKNLRFPPPRVGWRVVLAHPQSWYDDVPRQDDFWAMTDQSQLDRLPPLVPVCVLLRNPPHLAKSNASLHFGGRKKWDEMPIHAQHVVSRPWWAHIWWKRRPSARWGLCNWGSSSKSPFKVALVALGDCQQANQKNLMGWGLPPASMWITFSAFRVVLKKARDKSHAAILFPFSKKKKKKPENRRRMSA